MDLKSQIVSTLFKFNKIIGENQEKIRAIYGWVKLFDPTRINTTSLEERTKEVIAHFVKSTDPRSVHGRTLGEDQTLLSAIILAGFDINLYNCEFVDIATGLCIKDYDSNMIQTKDNDYFNMIINWYKMKIGGLEDSDIIENIDQIYQNCVSSSDTTGKSGCVISG